MDEHIDSLRDVCVFTTLDCNSRYWRVEISEEDRDKATFMSHHEMYRFTRMPLRLKNASAMFQRAINVTLSKVNWLYALVYLDDVIVFFNSLQEHFGHVKEILSIMSAASATLQLKKCVFFGSSVNYLRHINLTA